MPAVAIIFGIEPRLAIPMLAQAVQSMAMPRVGEVDPVPADAAAGDADRLDRVECRAGPLDSR